MGDDRDLTVGGTNERRRLTAGYPTQNEARAFLHAVTLKPTRLELIRSLQQHIWEQRGSVKANVDWTDPDEWIALRLADPAEVELAERLWRETEHKVNPRFSYGALQLSLNHQLLVTDADGILSISSRGQQFVAEPTGSVVGEIDAAEGILNLLQIVAERGQGKRADFLPAFAAFCRENTTWQSDETIKMAMYDRTRDLIDRRFLVRSGQTYLEADAGIKHLDRYAKLLSGVDEATAGARSVLLRQVREMSVAARAELSARLSTMHPYRFQGLVKLLLEDMGYTDVEVMSATNDMGVDVVATFEVGISTVREVVQVKRHKGSIGRPVLDQLRGTLFRLHAVRGTIITTGTFSKGTTEAAFEPGGAPITLIDGERLLGLLIEHEIGIRKQMVEYLEFDPTRLAAFEDGEDEAR